MELNAKWALWITVSAIVLFSVIIFYVGRQSKKGGPGSKPLSPDDLPNSGTGIPSGWTPSGLAEKLYLGMKGTNWGCWYDNGELFQAYATLQTDDMFKAVALDFKNRYGESLYQWVEDETPCGWGSRAQHWHNQIMARMDRLNMATT